MEHHELEDRVLKAEWRIEDHGRLIDELRSEAMSVSKDIREIQSTLHQIKWFAMGALFLYFADQVGLSAALKLIGA